MADFIDDGEIEESREANSSRKLKKHRKRKKQVNYRLDDEDREIIKENTGIELKPKNRLKRNADRQSASQEPEEQDDDDDKALVKKEIEVRQQTMQIDTTRKRGRGGADSDGAIDCSAWPLRLLRGGG